jgi:16S rRNA U1498 N3-methylase RsmE
MPDFTAQQLTERLQKLWIEATASCGSATPQLVEEIRELERLLQEMETQKESTS